LPVSIFRWEQNHNLFAEMRGTFLADWGHC
jgi:hypothetical protein